MQTASVPALSRARRVEERAGHHAARPALGLRWAGHAVGLVLCPARRPVLSTKPSAAWSAPFLVAKKSSSLKTPEPLPLCLTPLASPWFGLDREGSWGSLVHVFQQTVPFKAGAPCPLPPACLSAPVAPLLTRTRDFPPEMVQG